MRQISSSFWVSKGFELIYRCWLGKLTLLTQQPIMNQCAIKEFFYLRQKPEDKKFARSISFFYMKRSSIKDQAQLSSSTCLEMAWISVEKVLKFIHNLLILSYFGHNSLIFSYSILSGIWRVQIIQSYISETEHTKTVITQDSETVFRCILTSL